MAVIDNAIYQAGRRVAQPASLEQTYEALRSHPGGLAWIGLYRPDAAEIRSVAEEFALHPLAVEDTVKAHQRPKVERYGDVLFVVLRPARYLDDVEEVEFGEVHLFVGPDVVVTVRHAERPELALVRQRLEERPDLLARGSGAVLWAVLDQVVDEYAPVVAGLENDVDEIEDQVFDGDPAVSRRIYQLSREVIEFQRATRPLLGVLHILAASPDAYGLDDELQRHLRDVSDHAVRVVEQVEGFRVLLQNALTVHSTLVAQRQNDDMRRLTETSLAQNDQVRKISGWAAILFAPSLVGAVYGMNFTHMPELAWRVGYPLALALMVAVSVTLYGVFKWRGWL